MLAHLQIQNFAIVKTLELDFHHGMTTITGETGAGKSIAIDALGLCLGARAEAAMVRPNENKTEIVAVFNLANNTSAKNWLAENELLDGDECILRRVITSEGRSRAFINGCAVPASSQKALGQYLINIHGQHAHQLLMRSDYQLCLLDQYAGHQLLVQAMQHSYQQWHAKQKELQQLIKRKADLETQQQLLQYQVQELNELALAEDEYQTLEQEHKRLSNSGDIANMSQALLASLTEDEDNNALSLLRFAQQKIVELGHFDQQFTEFKDMLDEAMIQIQEVSYGVTGYINNLEMDAARLHYLDERLALILRLARKHQVSPDNLFATHQKLLQALSQLASSDERIEELTAERDGLHQQCLTNADKLSQSRMHYATELNTLITQSMHQLNMPHGQFAITLTHDANHVTALGQDHVDFLVSTNPGQPMQALSKVASGGELSRISLAIQVITAQKVETPSLIFDEVDVGISGSTAMVVGKLLRQLGESTQVMCVTHLPQVAGCGHQQMFVNKSAEQGSTTTSMVLLDQEARIHELARLLGGSEITATTLANAKELLVAA